MSYYVYSIPNRKAKGVLNTTEPPDSIRSRFRFGEYELTSVTRRRYWAILRNNFKYG